MNPRPIPLRKAIRILIALMILSWATQTLYAQWGYGQELPAEMRFVPGTSHFAEGATLEMRAEATVVGGEVTLRQVCRWSDRDQPAFEPIGDLLVMRIPDRTRFRSVEMSEIKSILHDAGVNLAFVRFAGPVTCTVARSDVHYDEKTALAQWIEARQPKAEVDDVSEAPELAPEASEPMPAAAVEPQPAPEPVNLDPPGRAGRPEQKAYRSLRDALVEDLAARTSLPADALQITFSAKDAQALTLTEPHFRFDIDARRARGLGNVTWDVAILSDGGSTQTTVAATARAWQRQLVLVRPVSFKQVFRDQDVTERRALVDRLADEPLLSREQTIGQQAARELKPGTVVTASLIEPVPLVKSGQFVSIEAAHGGVRVRSVAKAMENGAFGQTIRVKNEATKDVFEVTITGPQQAQMGTTSLSDARTGAWAGQ